MNKAPTTTKSVKKRGRKPSVNADKKRKVGVILTPEMVEFIEARVADGDAPTVTSWIFCQIVKIMKRYENNN